MVITSYITAIPASITLFASDVPVCFGMPERIFSNTAAASLAFIPHPLLCPPFGANNFLHIYTRVIPVCMFAVIYSNNFVLIYVFLGIFIHVAIFPRKIPSVIFPPKINTPAYASCRKEMTNDRWKDRY